MARARRVYHWKHGWIPVSPEAKAYVAGKGPRPITTDVAPETMEKVRQRHVDWARTQRAIMEAQKARNAKGGVIKERGGDFPLSDSQVAQVSEAVDQFFSLFPGLKQTIPRIPIVSNTTGNMSNKEAFATTDMRHSTEHVMELNQTLWDDESIRKLIADPGTKSVSIVGQAKTPAEFRNLAIKHEMGHVLASEMREKYGNQDGIAADQPVGPLDFLAAEMVTPRQTGFKDVNGDTSLLDTPMPRFVADALDQRSAYAISSPDEWIAEAILDGLVMGDKASTGGKKALAVAKDEFGPETAIQRIARENDWPKGWEK